MAEGSLLKAGFFTLMRARDVMVNGVECRLEAA
jgi:hypothetical protein